MTRGINTVIWLRLFTRLWRWLPLRYCSWNVSHQQQSFWRLLSPRRSHKTNNLMKTLHLTLKMTTAQVVETSVSINNSLSKDYPHLDDHRRQKYPCTFQHVTKNVPATEQHVMSCFSDATASRSHSAPAETYQPGISPTSTPVRLRVWPATKLSMMLF